MTLTASQIRYLPNLNYLQRIAKADVFVIMDSVQFNKRDYEHRNNFQINGNMKMLSLEVGKVKRGTLVRDVTFNVNAMLKEHKELIKKEYSHTEYYSPDLVEKLFKVPQNDNFFDFSKHSLLVILDYLEISTDVNLQSHIEKFSDYNKGISDMMNKFKCDTYISGSGGRNYLKEADYDIKYHSTLLNYKYSVLHYLFTIGKDSVKELIENNYEVED